MTAMAAVAMGVAFTSCSHNTDLYGGEEGGGKINGRTAQEQIELDKAVYKAAFEKTFGKVAPTVDWGFGSSTRALTRASSYGVQTIEPIFKFPTAPANSDFPTDKDENAELLTGYKDGTNLLYYIDESINGNGQTIQPNVSWNAAKKDLVLYVKGNVIPKDIYTPPMTTIYILPNSKLTIPASRSSFGQNYTHIYIGTGAELIIQGNQVEFGSGVKVYNKGTITAQNIVVSNDGLLYNMGTISTNELSVKNTSSVIVNDNTITANYLNTAGGGKIQNNYKMTINGETCINSNDNTWVNNGHYKTETFVYTAGSADVINNCYLEVTEDFNINLGDTQTNGFRIDAGGGVKTKNFNGGGPFSAKDQNGTNKSYSGGPYKIVMGSASVFKVTNEAHLNATAAATATSPYGFVAVGDDYAVFQAKKVKKEGKGHGNVVYSGNLYISAEEHFAQESDGYSDGASAILYQHDCSKENIYAPGFENGKPNITIEETPCNPGFEGDDDIPETFTYRVIAEDLSATEGSDFDFNDVVFDVEPNAAGDAAKIVVRAAGGIYRLTVAGQEVHAAFGATPDEEGLYPMINTQPWDSDTKATLIESYTGDFSSDEAIRNTINGITILVYKPGYEDNGAELEAKIGEPACKILVDQTFDVATEREDLGKKYNQFRPMVRGEFQSRFWWQRSE